MPTQVPQVHNPLSANLQECPLHELLIVKSLQRVENVATMNDAMSYEILEHFSSGLTNHHLCSIDHYSVSEIVFSTACIN
jgi:hypothetical protein